MAILLNFNKNKVFNGRILPNTYVTEQIRDICSTSYILNTRDRACDGSYNDNDGAYDHICLCNKPEKYKYTTFANHLQHIMYLTIMINDTVGFAIRVGQDIFDIKELTLELSKIRIYNTKFIEILLKTEPRIAECFKITKERYT